MQPGWASKLCVLAIAALVRVGAQPVEKITPGVSVVRGAVNGVRVERDGETLAIYGDPRPHPPAAAMVLFTHHRRDVVWAGRQLVTHGAAAVGPEAEKELFTGVAAFWETVSHQTLPRLRQPVQPHSGRAASRLRRTVRGGDTVDFQGLEIQVLDTPGYTRGAVSYLLRGRRQAHRLHRRSDLRRRQASRSVQPAGCDSRREGGWLPRLGRARRRRGREPAPDRGVEAGHPDSGARTGDPQSRRRPSTRSSGRLQAVFASHFAIDALRWYRGDDKIRAMAARVPRSRRRSSGCPWPKRSRRSCRIGSFPSPTRASSSRARARRSWWIAATAAWSTKSDG